MMETFTELTKHPALPTLLFCVLALPALVRIYRRVGLNPLPALLIFTSLIVPFFGLVLALFPLCIKAWPKFPKLPEKPKPLKSPI